MAKWARVENNKVIEVINFNPSGKFHPGISWTSVPDNVQQSWVIYNGIFSAPVTPIGTIKSRVWEMIKSERDKRKDGGFKVNGWWFHSDQPSRVQHLGLVVLGASLPEGIMWKTMSGEFVPLTPAVVSQIFASGLQLDTALFTQAEVHRVAMEASSDPEAYNYKTGWPENFLGL